MISIQLEDRFWYIHYEAKLKGDVFLERGPKILFGLVIFFFVFSPIMKDYFDESTFFKIILLKKFYFKNAKPKDVSKHL